MKEFKCEINESFTVCVDDGLTEDETEEMINEQIEDYLRSMVFYGCDVSEKK